MTRVLERGRRFVRALVDTTDDFVRLGIDDRQRIFFADMVSASETAVNDHGTS